MPVVAIPLLPYEEGYYFTPENTQRAAERYDEWRAWTAQHGLAWEGVGLDIEPEARFCEQIMDNPWGLVAMLLLRLVDSEQPRRAKAAYTALIDRIHANGYSVENYQFPLIADERWTGSTLLQRLMGLVDVRTHREVWMQYNAFVPTPRPRHALELRPRSPGLGCGDYGRWPRRARPPAVSLLSWEEFARDFRLARCWSDDLFVHSLEGCVWQGYLGRLRSFDWE